jgi:hypothetical protein
MKKGIGPRGLGSPAKMYGAKSPAKQTNEFGEKGQFNPYTEDSKSMGGQHRTHPRNAGRTKYGKEHQNVYVRNTSGDISKGVGASIGDKEHTMRRKNKTSNVMGLRAEAYKARENGFGVKKPKVSIK